MPKICYVPKEFRGSSLDIIQKANVIVEEYIKQGFDLTLRQLYYQFVSRGFIPNSQKSYKRLGSIINDARMAGLIDWNHITDRTRNVRRLSHWSSPADIVEACSEQYHRDLWSGQQYRVEVWIEKDALVGVIEEVCNRNDVAYFSCRGYTSQSEMWSAAQRLMRYWQNGITPVILHLGDHDPSGIDMSRDIEDRIRLFGKSSNRAAGIPLQFRRLALSMDQIQQYNPPPNPAKDTDARFESYTQLYGDECWELDALEPAVIADLIDANIQEFRNYDIWQQEVREQKRQRKELKLVADHWDTAVSEVEAIHGGGDSD